MNLNWLGLFTLWWICTITVPTDPWCLRAKELGPMLKNHFRWGLVEMSLTARHFFQTAKGCYGPIHWQLTRPGTSRTVRMESTCNSQAHDSKTVITLPAATNNGLRTDRAVPTVHSIRWRWSCVVIDRRLYRQTLGRATWLHRWFLHGINFWIVSHSADFGRWYSTSTQIVCHRCCGMNWYRHRQWNRNFGRVDPNLRARPLVLILVMCTVPLKIFNLTFSKFLFSLQMFCLYIRW